MSGVIVGGAGREQDGVRAMVIEPATVTSVLRVVGKKFTAQLNTPTDLVVAFGEDRWLQGVVLEVENHTPGDHAELEVLLPDDSVVAKFAETVYIKPCKRTEVIMMTSTLVPGVLRLRLRYTSVGTSGTPPEVYIDFITWREPV
jgi:hypothetical protein